MNEESIPQNQFNITWRDAGAEPKHPPNPAYPFGKDMDMADPGERNCHTLLPYPAKRIGLYLIECRLCGTRVALTTAGRPDDPRSLTLPCKKDLS